MANELHTIKLGNTSYPLRPKSFQYADNTITSIADDTTAKWGGLGCTLHFYSTSGQLTDQPSQYGLLFNLNKGSEVHQLWLQQASGTICHRGGNGNGWNGTWKKILDDSNYTTWVYPKTDVYTKTETGTQISNAIANLVDSAPGALDTLNELAAALGDDANFAATVTNSLATKFDKAGGTITGITRISRNNSSVDTMYYAQRTDMPAEIGFGIGTSSNRGIYDAAAGGWILKVDTNNTVTFSGKASTAGAADTAAKFASNATVKLTGDVTGEVASQKGWTVATTLANSGVTAGSYGQSANATATYSGTFSVPYITVDAKGRVTAASTSTITLPSDNNTIPSGHCTTAAATAAKTASFTYYTATAKRVFQINFRYANSAKSALTLNINSTGAKPIYINGKASSSSNYTIPAGPYLAYYDGTNYYINTDGYLYSNNEKVDMRLTTSLVPLGTRITASSSAIVDLNTTSYLKVGKYFCSATADTKWIKNCPLKSAFMMEVYSPLATIIDNETTGTWVYRLRKITDYNGGRQYFQICNTGATANTWNYGAWKSVLMTPCTLIADAEIKNGVAQSTTNNGSTMGVGSATQGVYIKSNGDITAMTYTLGKSVPSNAVFTDTTYSAGTGLSLSGTTFNHSNSVTAVGTAGLYKVKYDAQGHITGTSAITKADITGLGIPGSDTNTTYSAGTGLSLSGTTFSHSDTNTNISADTSYGPTADVTQSAKNTASFKVPQITLDQFGHVKSVSERTITVTDTDTNTDTKNTTGTTEKALTKLFLAGATLQADNPKTYSNSRCYIGTDNALYSAGERTITGLFINALGERVIANASGDINLIPGTNITFSLESKNAIRFDCYDTKVKQSAVTRSDNYPILMAYSPNPTSGTSSNVYYNTGVYINPSTKYIYGTGFFETSDANLKNFSSDIDVDLDKIKQLPKKYFTWKDGDQTQYIGTSAQEVKKIYPELVSDSDGTLTVDYAKLSVVALAAVDKLVDKQKELEDRLAKLETIVSKLTE